MSKLKFNQEMIEELRKNPNVRHVSKSSITYTKEFKEHFIAEQAKGILTRIIFENSDFDISKLGESRIKSATHRWGNAENESRDIGIYNKQTQGVP